MRTCASELQIEYKNTSKIKTNERNARTHSTRQIAQIKASIEKFGFANPVLIDEHGTLIAGHGRLQAAIELGLETLPTIALSHLSDEEKRALMLADNKIALNAGWNIEILTEELVMMTSIDPDFDISVTGFETAEIDGLVDSGTDTANNQLDPDDQFDNLSVATKAISKPGDLWILGEHRLFCGNALSKDSYWQLLDGEFAEQTITDPPYNVPIDGHVSGLGKNHHREFEMASGEMTAEEFTSFLKASFNRIAEHSKDGAIIMVFMDWRHVEEITTAADAVSYEVKNLVVWDKVNGGMGSLYRSQHELVFVLKSGKAPHINNIELGKHGRYRTNIWRYPGANMFRKNREKELSIHPTVKPVGMIADAIKDCSKRNGIILDPFAGSGTIILAAERTGRKARAIEIDPLYMDVAIRRWQDTTGKTAVLSKSGECFSDLETADNDKHDLESN